MTDGLDIRDIHHRYDTDEVVRGVSLAVGPGEIVCLLGPSGCGKTTCLRLAAGLERLHSGEIRVAGTLVAGPGVHVPPEERRVGLVLQDYALFPHLTATANVAFGLSGPGVSRRGRADRERIAVDLLAQVGLAGYETAYPHMLSGGQQQRVALARALAPEPDVMLMDEPFSGLDVTLRGEVRETTAAVLKQRGAPTLVVTHDPDEALAIGDRIAIMRDGRIVQSGTAEDIYLNPADPFVMTFFGHSNRLAGRVEGGGVATPFGRVPAPGLEDGRPAAVLFRSSALSLAANGQGTAAQVTSARLLGPVQRVVLRLDDGVGLVMERARRQPLTVGDQVRLKADFDEFRVFADHPGVPDVQ